MTPNKQRAAKIIQSIDQQKINRYRRYWSKLRATDHLRYYRAFQFAYMSVHTTWTSNVKGFQELLKLGTDFSKRQLKRAITVSGVGLNRIRELGLWSFHRNFWDDPESWYPKENESVNSCRDRLVDRLFGLGDAKTSFALELAFPTIANVVCLDVHLLRLYNVEHKKVNRWLYRDIEAHWCRTCRRVNVPSPIARHIYWDTIQGKPNTRYWSFVLEQGNTCDFKT